MTISTILTLWYGFGIFIGLLTVPWAIRREKEILRTVEQDAPQETPKGFWAYYTTAEGQKIRQFFLTPQEYTMVVDREKRIANERLNPPTSDTIIQPPPRAKEPKPFVELLFAYNSGAVAKVDERTMIAYIMARDKGLGRFVVVGDNNALDVLEKPKPMPTEMTR